MNTNTQTPLVAAVQRLAVTKDQKRVLAAVADAGDWVPVTALFSLLGKTGAKRVGDALLILGTEHLLEHGEHDGEPCVRARPVEAWDKDEHFLLGAEIAWP
jgi:hypothetical protein